MSVFEDPAGSVGCDEVDVRAVVHDEDLPVGDHQSHEKHSRMRLAKWWIGVNPFGIEPVDSTATNSGGKHAGEKC